MRRASNGRNDLVPRLASWGSTCCVFTKQKIHHYTHCRYLSRRIVVHVLIGNKWDSFSLNDVVHVFVPSSIFSRGLCRAKIRQFWNEQPENVTLYAPWIGPPINRRVHTYFVVNNIVLFVQTTEVCKPLKTTNLGMSDRFHTTSGYVLRALSNNPHPLLLIGSDIKIPSHGTQWIGCTQFTVFPTYPVQCLP